MPREIVHCQVGQCGNQIGLAFWETMRNEHYITTKGKFEPGAEIPQERYSDYTEKVGVYFRDTTGDLKKLVPRACLIDLEPGIMDVIKASPAGNLFNQNNMIFGASGAGNNWAKGHYTAGAELIDEVKSKVRKEAEVCDCLQGFQICHSLGGGTGSGLGTLLLMKLRDDYPDRLSCTYSVYPSPRVSDVVVEPYNATLSIHQLLENSDETFVIDNEALYNISQNVLKQTEPKYSELNWVISLVMAGITASLRFPGQLNGDLRKMGVNLVPFPRLHFFLMSQGPLFTPDQKGKVQVTCREVTDQMWNSRNFLANIKPEEGKYLTANCTYRGDFASVEVDNEVRGVQTKSADDFVNWIPNNIKSSMISVASPDTARSGTFVANTTAIKSVFQRISSQFARMYKRKAFLHWYLGEGMDELEFQEADKNVRDLVTEYQDKQDAVVELDNLGAQEAGSDAGSEAGSADGSAAGSEAGSADGSGDAASDGS